MSKPTFSQPAGFTDNLFLDGWNNVVGFTFDANGRMFVYEKRGTVWIVENGVKSANPLIDISEEVGNWRDFGLLGFALDPGFLTNGYFYLNYVVDRHHLLNFGTGSYNPNANEYFNATIGRVTRYQADSGTNFTTTLPGSRQILIGETKETGMPILHESHGVGDIVFGEDGTLMVCMGDGASYNSVDQGSAGETYYAQALTDGIITPAENIGAYRCQVLFSHNGKILRIDPTTGDGLSSNPFYDANNPRSPQSRVWSLGVRNPYRMTHKPGTGAHHPEDGDPGVFYFGDVGWGTWEDLNVNSVPGQNFGWPKWEGITNMPGYNDPTYAPAVHERPKIDFRHGQNNARGVIAGGTVVNVGSPQLPGNPFPGNASTGGFWYTGTDFPATWQNTYFHADYGAGWIRNFIFDANHNPLEVREFVNNAGPVVHLDTHPLTGGLYYVKYTNEIRQIQYTGSGKFTPVARVSTDVNFGASPLVVEFTGDRSYDPESGQLSYFWDFGDGNTSTAANPAHIFSGGTLTTYNVTLTVTDNQSQTDQTTLPIFLNNTPPDITSTSIDNTDTFDPITGTTLNLNAVVTDAEHPSGQLSWTWETFFFHNDHMHAEPEDHNPSTSTNLSPVACSGATFWYRVKLTVTDPEGLASVFVKDIFPNCPGSSQTISLNPIPDKNILDAPFVLTASASSGLPVELWVMDGPAVISGNTVTLLGQPGTVKITATQPGDATFAPAIPVEKSFEVEPVILGERGFRGTYFNNMNLTNQVLQRTDPAINFDWGSGSPDLSIGANTFSVRWEADLTPEFSETYTFYTTTDDGVRLWVDNQLIIDQWVDQSATTHTGTISLTAGQSVPLKMEFYENGGQASAKLEWSSASLAREIIPKGAVFPVGGIQEQTLSFDPIPDKLITDPPFSISATATSGLAPNFTIVTGPATVSGNQITLDGNPGIVIVRASQAGDADFNPAPDVERAFTVTLPGGGGDIDLELSLSVNPSVPGIYTNFALTATLTNTGAATATGIRVHIPKAGEVVYTGGNEYNASLGVFNPYTSQEWEVGILLPGASATLDLNYFLLQNTPFIAFGQVVAANENDADSTPGNGTCSPPGGCVANEDDEASVPVPNVGPQNQVINFPGIPDKNLGDPPFQISATATSGLPVSFSIDSGPATVSGNTITLTGSLGMVTVRASQSGDADWNPAPDVTRSFNVTDPGLMDQTITFDPIPNKITTDPPFNVNATASSGLPVTLAIDSGPAAISGNTITLDGTPGTVVVRASQGGDAQWNPAMDVTQSFDVNNPPGANDIDLEVSLTADKSILGIWENTIFTVTVTNKGNVTASGIILDVPVPAGLAYTNVFHTKGIYNLYYETWNLGDLTVGESATLDIVLFVLQNSTPLDYFVEVIAANENDADSTPGNGTCSPPGGCVPNEDDEGLWTLQPPGAIAYGTDEDVFTLSVKQKSHAAELLWVTNMGSQIDRFVIERSSDGFDYQSFITRENEEPNDWFMTYRDKDNLPAPGLNFYRVKQEHHDGTFTFSNAQMLEFPEGMDDFQIFPNPADNYVEVSLRPVAGQPVGLKILNLMGREMYSEVLESASVSPHRVDLSEFRDGYYVVLIQSPNRRVVVRKLVVSGW